MQSFFKSRHLGPTLIYGCITGFMAVQVVLFMSFPKRKLSSSILVKLGSSKLSKNANNPRANKAKYVVAFP